MTDARQQEKAVTWFLFDLGNTVIKLAYERVIESICRDSNVDRDELLDILEEAGGYRDMERGAVTFWDFYEFLSGRVGYRAGQRTFREAWSDFFDGPIPGIEEVLERVRARYRVAFLSNSNEVHAEVIPRKYSALFERDDRFIFSYRFRVAKPDPEMFHRALEVVGALPDQAVLVDDLIENVIAARAVGMKAYQFRDTAALVRELEGDGLL
ncbi:MAG TPA: HAD family phosphatase [Thermoanaerobaculia bacterium]|nr:HAD family phosphatase [Thermoanaerobaculia bacterium]